MRDTENMVRLCEEIVKNIKYPLTVKMRLHENVETTISIMKKLENVGVAGFTLHGRFWWQKGDKRGIADWYYITARFYTFFN